MHITATFATIIIIIIIIIILFFFYYYNLNGSQNERGRFYQKKSINRTASNLVLLNEKSSSLCLHSYLVFCCACVLICTLHGCSGKFQTQTCTLFFFSFYISKFCRLKSVVTSISLNPRVATNLKKKKEKKNTKWYFQGRALWKCLAQKHLLRYRSRVHIHPLSLLPLSVSKLW